MRSAPPARILRLRRTPLALTSTAQIVQLFSVKFANLARLEIQNQRPITYAANLLDEVANLLEHLAQLAVAAFDEHHFVPGIVPLSHLAHARRRGVHLAGAGLFAIDLHAPAQHIELSLGRLATHLHQVSLLNMRSRASQFVGQLAVIGHQQQAFAQVVEPSHRVEPLRHLGEELHHRGAALGVARRSHKAPGLVENEVAVPLRFADQLAVHADVVAPQVSLGAQRRHHLAVHLDAAFGDQLLGVTATRDPGLRQNLLQPFQLGRRTLVSAGFIFADFL